MRRMRTFGIAAAVIILAGASGIASAGAMAASSTPIWVDSSDDLVPFSPDVALISAASQWQGTVGDDAPVFTKDGVTGPNISPSNAATLVHSYNEPAKTLATLVRSAGMVAVGDVTVAIAYREPGATRDGVLLATAPGAAAFAPNSRWINSANQSEQTIEEIQASLPANATISGILLQILGNKPATPPAARITSFTFAGHRTFFTPTPTAPSKLTSQPGGEVRVQATGFLSGEDVEGTLRAPGSAARLNLATLKVNREGEVDGTFVVPSGTDTGKYVLTLTGQNSDIQIEIAVVLLEDPTDSPTSAPAPAPTPSRPSTGATSVPKPTLEPAPVPTAVSGTVSFTG